VRDDDDGLARGVAGTDAGARRSAVGWQARPFSLQAPRSSWVAMSAGPL
jgi:hypothetical protein